MHAFSIKYESKYVCRININICIIEKNPEKSLTISKFDSVFKTTACVYSSFRPKALRTNKKF